MQFRLIFVSGTVNIAGRMITSSTRQAVRDDRAKIDLSIPPNVSFREWHLIGRFIVPDS
jgi:hypothetical protein